jgi:hypothetical protein
MREALPGSLRFWKDRLRENRFLQSLPCAEQREWLEDKCLYKKNGEYNGGRMNAGFSGKSLYCRAMSAGIPDGVLWKLHRQFSAHVHMAPHAVDQIRAFHPVDSIGRSTLVEFPVLVSTAVLALAVGSFLQLFPECRQKLNCELKLLLDCYPEVLSRLADEARREMGAADGEGETDRAAKAR